MAKHEPPRGGMPEVRLSENDGQAEAWPRQMVLDESAESKQQEWVDHTRHASEEGTQERNASRYLQSGDRGPK